MRCDSAIEVPGTAAMCRVKWPSFSSGRNSAPKNGSAAQPIEREGQPRPPW